MEGRNRIISSCKTKQRRKIYKLYISNKTLAIVIPPHPPHHKRKKERKKRKQNQEDDHSAKKENCARDCVWDRLIEGAIIYM